MKWENYVAEVTLRKKGSLFLDFKGNKIFNLKKFMGTNNLVLQNRVHDCYHETSRLYTSYMNFHCDALYIIPSLNNFCKWQIEENCSLIFGFSTFSKMYKKTSIYFSVSRTTRGGRRGRPSLLKNNNFYEFVRFAFISRKTCPNPVVLCFRFWMSSAALQNSYLLFLVIYSLLIFSRDSNAVSLKIVFTMNFWYTLFFLEATGLISNQGWRT